MIKTQAKSSSGLYIACMGVYAYINTHMHTHTHRHTHIHTSHAKEHCKWKSKYYTVFLRW